MDVVAAEEPTGADLGRATSPQVGAATVPDGHHPGPLLIPLGALEQHGPHLPLSSDSTIAAAVCDRVAERRFHGGPDRALCHYPTQHYLYWAQRFAPLRTQLGLGAFGENLGSEGLNEAQLCIGDRLRWGDALIEVSQPRSPCVRLDTRHGMRGLARELSASGRTGWSGSPPCCRARMTISRSISSSS